MIVLEGLLILDEFCAGRFHTDTKHRQFGHGRAKTRSNDVILTQQSLPLLQHVVNVIRPGRRIRHGCGRLAPDGLERNCTKGSAHLCLKPKRAATDVMLGDRIIT